VSIQIGDDAQEDSGGSYKNIKEEEQSHSPTVNAEPSSSSPSSTLVRLRRLSEIYETYNFCVVESEYFEQAIGVEVWRNVMEDEINLIMKNDT